MKLGTIDLVSTDNLLDELENRFTHYVFCGNKPKEDCGEKVSETHYRTFGDNRLTLIGLSSHVEHIVNKTWIEDSK